VYINATEAGRLGCGQGDTVTVRQEGGEARLPIMIDDRVADGCAFIPSGLNETAGLGASFGPVEIAKN
jgi:NADH-quinone oxidoreductase subunit G